MANGTDRRPSAESTWVPRQVYAMAVVCLLVGLVIGYLFRGSQSPAPAAQAVNAPPSAPATGVGGNIPGLEEMKQMADTKAAPLLQKLKSDPNNAGLLLQIGSIYQTAHQFRDAIGYYDQALAADPKNTPIRTEKASCMYYSGDIDGAIGQLQQALQYSPRDANSLFNLGMMKWQGKQDAKGALAAWHELLQSNPQLSPEQRAQVAKLIADAQTQVKN
jgi:cytochrome c-type biogenesis protein CcmH/NrfG